MTRKDYVTLATDLAIDWKVAQDSTNPVAVFNNVLISLCAALKRDNANFDREKFIAAVTRK